MDFLFRSSKTLASSDGEGDAKQDARRRNWSTDLKEYAATDSGLPTSESSRSEDSESEDSTRALSPSMTTSIISDEFSGEEVGTTGPSARDQIDTASAAASSASAVPQVASTDFFGNPTVAVAMSAQAIVGKVAQMCIRAQFILYNSRVREGEKKKRILDLLKTTFQSIHGPILEKPIAVKAPTVVVTRPVVSNSRSMERHDGPGGAYYKLADVRFLPLVQLDKQKVIYVDVCAYEHIRICVFVRMIKCAFQ